MSNSEKTLFDILEILQDGANKAAEELGDMTWDDLSNMKPSKEAMQALASTIKFFSLKIKMYDICIENLYNILGIVFEGIRPFIQLDKKITDKKQGMNMEKIYEELLASLDKIKSNKH